MLRATVTGMFAVGVLLAAGVVMAQTGTPPAGESAQAIVPVTGPSVAPGLPGPAKPEVIPAMVSGDAKTGEIPSKGRVTSAGHPGPHAAKVAHKPGAKSTVKKTAPPTKHVAKGAGTGTKHVAHTKAKAPVHHAMVGKAVPVTKHQTAVPAAKGAATQPVLPRV